MLTTERLVSPTRVPARNTTRSVSAAPARRAAVVRVLGALRAAGGVRAWACLALTGYVLGVAVLNLARYGLER